MKRLLFVLLLWWGAGLPAFSLPTAPAFDGVAVDGTRWDRGRLTQRPLTLLIFFSSACRACLEMIDTLQSLAGEDVQVVAVSSEPVAGLVRLARQRGWDSPVLHAGDGVLKRYRALGVYPTVYVLGPGGVVLDRFQGSAATGQSLWLVIADRLMQRQRFVEAAGLYRRIDAPKLRDRARLGLGYALLRQGNLPEARRIFESLLSSSVAAGAWEGMAEWQLQRGDLDAAEAAVNEALALDPARPVARTLESRIRFRRHQLEGAEASLAKAERNLERTEFSWQKAETLVAKGNLARRLGKPKLALASYEAAAKAAPLAVAPVSNQAVVLLEDLKQPEKALKVLKRARQVAPADALLQALVQQARETLAFQEDMERRRYVQKLVETLAARYRRQRETPPPQSEDDWTSPPLALSVLAFRDRSPTLMGRVGVEKVLRDALIDQLRARGVSVVEREILDRLLDELDLGSSRLASQDVQLRLGRVMASRLLAFGTLFSGTAGKGRSFLRLVETETTRIVASLSQPLETADPLRLAERYAGQIERIVREQYPLRGRIALVEDGQVAINLGRRHGVRPGMVFTVLADGEPIELNGRVLGYRRRAVGRLQVTEVEDGFSMARILEASEPLARNQKVELKPPA